MSLMINTLRIIACFIVLLIHDKVRTEECYSYPPKMWFGDQEDCNKANRCGCNVCQICPDFYVNNVECYEMDAMSDFQGTVNFEKIITCEDPDAVVNQISQDCLTLCDDWCQEQAYDDLSSIPGFKMFCCTFDPSNSNPAQGTCSYKLTHSKFYFQKQPELGTASKTKLYTVKRDHLPDYNGYPIEFNDQYQWFSDKYCHDPVGNESVNAFWDWPKFQQEEKITRKVKIPFCNFTNGDTVDSCRQKCQAYCETIYDHGTQSQEDPTQVTSLAYCCVLKYSEEDNTGYCEIYGRVLANQITNKEGFSENDQTYVNKSSLPLMNNQDEAVYNNYETQLINGFGRPIYWQKDQACQSNDQLQVYLNVQIVGDNGIYIPAYPNSAIQFEGGNKRNVAFSYALDQCRLACINMIRTNDDFKDYENFCCQVSDFEGQDDLYVYIDVSSVHIQAKYYRELNCTITQDSTKTKSQNSSPDQNSYATLMSSNGGYAQDISCQDVVEQTAIPKQEFEQASSSDTAAQEVIYIKDLFRGCTTTTDNSVEQEFTSLHIFDKSCKQSSDRISTVFDEQSNGWEITVDTSKVYLEEVCLIFEFPDDTQLKKSLSIQVGTPSNAIITLSSFEPNQNVTVGDSVMYFQAPEFGYSDSVDDNCSLNYIAFPSNDSDSTIYEVQVQNGFVNVIPQDIKEGTTYEFNLWAEDGCGSDIDTPLGPYFLIVMPEPLPQEPLPQEQPLPQEEPSPEELPPVFNPNVPPLFIQGQNNQTDIEIIVNPLKPLVDFTFNVEQQIDPYDDDIDDIEIFVNGLDETFMVWDDDERELYFYNMGVAQIGRYTIGITIEDLQGASSQKDFHFEIKNEIQSEQILNELAEKEVEEVQETTENEEEQQNQDPQEDLDAAFLDYNTLKPTTATVGNWTNFVSSEKLNSEIDKFVNELEKPSNEESQPLKLIIESINNNGKSRLEFSQPTILPSFLTKEISNDTRRLDTTNSTDNNVTLSKINAEFLFKISILREMPEQDDDSEDQILDLNLRNEFFLNITEWTEDFIEIFTNFTFPLEVSNGKYKDRMHIQVLNPKMFVSASTKMPLDPQFLSLVKEIPSQLPKSIDGQVLSGNTKKLVIFSTVILIINILIQIVFQSNKGESTSIILQMQNTVVLTLFEVNIPAQLQIVIDEVRSLVNLQNMKPQGVLEILSKNKNFEELQKRSTVQLQSNLEASGATSLDGKDSLSGFLLIPLCGLTLLMLVSGVALAIEKWYKTEIREKLRQLKKQMLWNDIITPLNLSYYTNCVVFYMLIDLKGTKKGREASFISFILVISIFVQPIVSFLILRKHSMRELLYIQNSKYQNSLYPGLKHSWIGNQECIMKYRKYFQILVYFRRFMIIMTPLLYKNMASQQLIFLQVFQLTFMILYIKLDPHWRQEKIINLTNEVLSLLSFISLLTLSEAVPSSETRFNNAFLTCFIIGLQLAFNLFILGSSMLRAFFHQKNIKQRTVIIERIKDPTEKSYEGKVRSIHFRLKQQVYRADPKRFLITKQSVSGRKILQLRLKKKHPIFWEWVLGVKRFVKRTLRRKRYIYLPMEIIKEKQEFQMRDDDLEEIDEMWAKYYDVECRRNRHRRKMFPLVKKFQKKYVLHQQQRAFLNELEVQNTSSLQVLREENPRQEEKQEIVNAIPNNVNNVELEIESKSQREEQIFKLDMNQFSENKELEIKPKRNKGKKNEPTNAKNHNQKAFRKFSPPPGGKNPSFCQKKESSQNQHLKLTKIHDQVTLKTRKDVQRVFQKTNRRLQQQKPEKRADPQKKNLSVIQESAEVDGHHFQKMKRDLEELRDHDQKWLEQFKKNVPLEKELGDNEVIKPCLLTDLKVSSKVFKPVIGRSLVPISAKESKPKKGKALKKKKKFDILQEIVKSEK